MADHRGPASLGPKQPHHIGRFCGDGNIRVEPAVLGTDDDFRPVAVIARVVIPQGEQLRINALPPEQANVLRENFDPSADCNVANKVDDAHWIRVQTETNPEERPTGT